MNFENEIWKDIAGYDGLYQVSNLGRVKSVLRIVQNGNKQRRVDERIMIPVKTKGGYIRVTLKDHGRNKTKTIHRLVAEAFIPNKSNLPQINHKDEDKTNNKVENLEWCTAQYNSTYGTRISRLATKLSKPVIQYSMDGKIESEFPSVKIAAESLNVSSSSIYTCVLGVHPTAYGYRWAYK